MANKYRGEFDITINGKTYTLAPTFEALVEFEDLVGITAFEAMRDMAEEQKAPAKVIVGAIWAGILGYHGGNKIEAPTFGHIGRECQAQGITSLMTEVMRFLANALASEETINAQIEKAGKDEGGE